MYLDTYNVLTTKEVVETYVELATDWIKNAKMGKSLEDSYPLDAAVDKDSIESLQERIELLNQIIVPNIENISFKVVLQ